LYILSDEGAVVLRSGEFMLVRPVLLTAVIAQDLPEGNSPAAPNAAQALQWRFE